MSTTNAQQDVVIIEWLKAAGFEHVECFWKNPALVGTTRCRIIPSPQVLGRLGRGQEEGSW